MDNNTGISGDNPTGKLYWPSVFGNPLTVSISKIVYSGAGSPGYHRDNGESDAVLAASGFQRPSGLLLHYDVVGSTGYRLLPNYGIGNLMDINGLSVDTYTPTLGVTGGTLPGFSTDNGLEIYLDVVWSSDCGPAQNCFDPILT